MDFSRPGLGYQSQTGVTHQEESSSSMTLVNEAIYQQYTELTSSSSKDNNNGQNGWRAPGQMKEGFERENHQEGNDYDLFASTFGRQKPHPADEDDDMDEVGRQRTAGYTFQDCTNDTPSDVRGASTPPSERASSTKELEPDTSKTTHIEPDTHDPNFPHAFKSLSVPLVQHQKLHIRCFQLIPRLDLASHRYWIAVIEPKRRPENVRKETHLTWMKGNRFTTAKTVKHYFKQAGLVTEEFVLLHAGRKVADDVMVQELDLWDDKFVLFRAVWAHSAAAKGRDVAQGLVVEIIELD